MGSLQTPQSPGANSPAGKPQAGEKGWWGQVSPGAVAARVYPSVPQYLMMTHWFSPSISMFRYMLSVRA